MLPHSAIQSLGRKERPFPLSEAASSRSDLRPSQPCTLAHLSGKVAGLAGPRQPVSPDRTVNDPQHSTSKTGNDAPARWPHNTRVNYRDLIPASATDDDLVWILDDQLKLVWANAAWQDFARANRGEDIAHPENQKLNLLDHLSGSQRERWKSISTMLLDGRLKRHEEEFICPAPAQRRQYHLSVYPIPNASGRSTWLVHHSRLLPDNRTPPGRLAWQAPGMEGSEVNARSYQRQVMDRQFSLQYVQVACDVQPLQDIGGDVLWHHEYANGQVDFLIADVMGHGETAARIANRILLLLDTLTRLQTPPAQLIASLNRAMLDPPSARVTYATGILLRLTPQSEQIEIISFGHAAPIFSRGGVLQLEHGPPVGLSDAFVAWSPQVLSLRDLGDRCLLYSDGVTEQFDPAGEMYGRERLARSFARSLDLPLGQALAHLNSDLQTHRGDALVKDDRLLCLLQCNI